MEDDVMSACLSVWLMRGSSSGWPPDIEEVAAAAAAPALDQVGCPWCV